MIRIDGSIGEGGGQILRTSLALSMVAGQPFRIENIRAERPKPGLLRQQMTSVQASCAVSGGSASGAELGSVALEFAPGAVRGGAYTFAIGTAGSTTLVLQTVLPALMLTSEPSTLTISGGTHNTHAPTVHFLSHAFLPVLAHMGPKVAIHLDNHWLDCLVAAAVAASMQGVTLEGYEKAAEVRRERVRFSELQRKARMGR